MKNAPVNPLSAEFLYELYAAALRYDTLCGVVAENMRKEYLPDRSFQKIQEVIANHYRTYKSPPTYATLSQTFQGDYDAIELLKTFREYEEDNSNTEALTDLLEGYIKGVRLQKALQPEPSGQGRGVARRICRVALVVHAPHYGVRGRGENLPGAFRAQPPP